MTVPHSCSTAKLATSTRWATVSHSKPLLGLGYVRVGTDGFLKNGRSHYNLRVKGGSGESLTSNLGARASLERTTGNGTLITVDARLLWQHEFQHDHQSVDASFAVDTSFSVSGSKFRA